MYQSLKNVGTFLIMFDRTEVGCDLLTVISMIALHTLVHRKTDASASFYDACSRGMDR